VSGVVSLADYRAEPAGEVVTVLDALDDARRTANEIRADLLRTRMRTRTLLGATRRHRRRMEQQLRLLAERAAAKPS
jgi:hypothetical protein